MIDLRSDTVTKPSLEMRELMANAAVGDDVYQDDTTMNEFETKVAKLFGKEAGVFVPSGSLSNQLGIRLFVKPGEELITETNSHIVRAELGAAATFSGITTRTWLADRGVVKADDVIEICKPNSGPYLVSTKAIAIENTHNFGGGSVQSLKEISRISEFAKNNGMAMHLDGARVWNAHIASGASFVELAKDFDSVSQNQLVAEIDDADLRMQLEEQRNAADREMEMKMAQMKMMTERNTQVLLAHINNGAKIEVARIGAEDSDGAQAYMSEEEAAKAMEHPMQPIANAIGQGNAQMAQAISALVDTINAQHNRPKTVIRGQDGKIIGVQ
mgnify:CR=1 FL=1